GARARPTITCRGARRRCATTPTRWCDPTIPSRWTAGCRSPDPTSHSSTTSRRGERPGRRHAGTVAMNPAMSVVLLTTLIGAGQGLFVALYAVELANLGAQADQRTL